MIKNATDDASHKNKATRKGFKLHRGLTNRHVQLISLGGAIGVGLFMGSGKTIHLSGTSIILTYAIIGFFLFFTMRAMGELLLSNLRYKSFADFCSAYLGPWAGFFIGWSYWMIWIVGVVNECVIIGGYSQYWWPELSPWIPALATMSLLLALNCVAVKLFGELEFWFAMIKIVAILMLIGVGIYLVASSFVSPTGVKASLSHLTDRHVFMPNGVTGFLAGFQIAIFSFAGIELIGTTAAETKDPRQNLPRAINSVPLRIFIFYVLSISAIIAVSSWQLISPDSSPFVRLFTLAGFPMAAAFVNMIVTLSAMSSANSGVFSTSRMLYGLSVEKHAPSYFSKLTRSVPVRSIGCSFVLMFIGAALLYFNKNIMSAFTLLSSITSILYLFVWSMIHVAYIKYRRTRSDLHRCSSFKMPGGIVMSAACIAFFTFSVSLLVLDKDSIKALYMAPFWFGFLWFAYKKSRPLKNTFNRAVSES